MEKSAQNCSGGIERGGILVRNAAAKRHGGKQEIVMQPGSSIRPIEVTLTQKLGDGPET
jgi:hypothetical protein